MSRTNAATLLCVVYLCSTSEVLHFSSRAAKISQKSMSRSKGNYLQNVLIISSSFQSFFMQKCQTVAGSDFLNVKICCFSSSSVTVNVESLGFGLLVGQEERFEDVALSENKSVN